jgi:hypothetical protein
MNEVERNEVVKRSGQTKWKGTKWLNEVVKRSG